ncbi:MAG: tetratricopeptide repeat protein [Spirochaetaceae bacterium]|nr:tetratricopeptide repeat protein [Spirochaetaceae bacterium]
MLCAAALAQLALPSGAVAQTADALTEYRNGAFNAAIEICHREIALQPDNLESYVVLCWSLLRLGRYPEAAAGAEKAAALNRYDVRVIEIQGELDYYRGRNDSALLHFQEYVNLAPEGTRIETVYYFIGEIYIRLGRFRHADIALSTALHYVPGNPRWWTRLAYAREMSGDAQAAAQAYKTALDLDGSISDAARGLERQRAALERR